MRPIKIINTSRKRRVHHLNRKVTILKSRQQVHQTQLDFHYLGILLDNRKKMRVTKWSNDGSKLFKSTCPQSISLTFRTKQTRKTPLYDRLLLCIVNVHTSLCWSRMSKLVTMCIAALRSSTITHVNRSSYWLRSWTKARTTLLRHFTSLSAWQIGTLCKCW